MNVEILFEDDDILVVSKPAGMIVHPAPGHPDGTLVDALLAHWQARGYVRFRIDGQVLQGTDVPPLDGAPHDVDLVVDRLRVRADAEVRLSESFEAALAQHKTSAQVITAMKAAWPKLAEPASLELSAKVNTGEMKW